MRKPVNWNIQFTAKKALIRIIKKNAKNMQERLTQVNKSSCASKHSHQYNSIKTYIPS